MKTITGITLAALALAGGAAFAQAERDEDPREAYRRGYEEGFARGYRKGLDEAGGTRAVPVAPAPVPLAPPRSTGPITVSRAVYGNGSRVCEATRWAARHANGRSTATLDVTNNICGDPAPGARKSLDVTYVCGSIAKTASANEHRSITLDCTP